MSHNHPPNNPQLPEKHPSLMSYTHYYEVTGWSTPQWKGIAWPHLTDDVPRIIEASGVPMSGAGTRWIEEKKPDKKKKNKKKKDKDGDDRKAWRELPTPIVSNVDDGIIIDGIAENGFEPLVMISGRWEYVNTGRRPYDVVVACVLLRAWMLAPDGIAISSDGAWDEEEWVRARELYHSLWPRDQIRCPWEKSMEE